MCNTIGSMATGQWALVVAALGACVLIGACAMWILDSVRHERRNHDEE